ncbi:MAG: hypothetical protein HYY33_06285 [Chloroflexi bacterium]|nr:hypothetical protein [Chloroflexota bacterium]
MYDFSMNSTGRSLTRATDSSAWAITGNLRVDAGTVSFGASTGGHRLRQHSRLRRV